MTQNRIMGSTYSILMPRIATVIAILCTIGELGSCSSPERPASTVYPQDARISSPEGIPRDSSTSFFPASASVVTSQDARTKRLGDCRFMSGLISKELFWFKAPVLSNYYLGRPIYRFLWAPPFGLPVLLTVELNETDGVLNTRFVNRYPQAMLSSAQVVAWSKPEIERINELKRMIQAGQEVADNTERLTSAVQRLDYIKLSGTPLIITDKATVLSPRQIQQFIGLLNQVKFWQSASCQPSDCFDGANYTLEAHEANRYHMVNRGCFMENSEGIYNCCKFLLDLSPAKSEANN
ncbi:hypothetical protein Q5H92_24135 [Hymenobacter sp. M29]|uniref:Uncharacterized protein n=1 Tax=Hymenobacter mellowenesis TaxID=3063995 RepID=A0ABT9AHX2_9BACT|nr:hypothetical protein [Hymenobacter sp. M29]MDO7849476.1 hypothetical protein [Hymenobacter sp. M29]